jgi:DNA-binding NarL/FixJ family response regulator
MIRILLVDDQDIVRRGLRALLSTADDLVVVGEAVNGQMAIDLLDTITPDVVLMDIRMPVMDGVVATERILARLPACKVLVLTTFADQEYVNQALQNGASGYLLKDTPFEELTQSIHLVHKGYTQLGPGLSPQLLPPLSVASGGNDRSDISIFEQLTAREQEILHHISMGASNREIAEQLYISEKTVRNHITHILSQLGLRDRTQAAIYMHTIVRPK